MKIPLTTAIAALLSCRGKSPDPLRQIQIYPLPSPRSGIAGERAG